MLSTGDLDVTGQVAMQAWAIWKQRNELVHQGTQPDVQRTVEMAHELWVEWKGYANEKKSKPIMEQEGESWKKPNEGLLKINLDVGWSGSNGQGFGMVIRDHRGECMFAATSFYPHRAAPIVAESEALRWAIQMAQRLELTHIILETDAKNVVENFLGHKDTPADRKSVV